MFAILAFIAMFANVFLYLKGSNKIGKRLF